MASFHKINLGDQNFWERRLRLALRLLFSFLLLAPSAFAQTSSSVPVIVVGGESEVRGLGLRKDTINRVQSIDKKEFQRKKAQTFAQALDDERGVDTQTACAFCGAKRITINGLRGEHTTILVDGLPLHSTVSSFYGVEAIPLPGIEAIDIYRGSGASLAAPEAIGGAINILTADPFLPIHELRASGSDDGQSSLSGLATGRISDRVAFLLGVQAGVISSVDVDRNGVTEQPRQELSGVMGKVSVKLNQTDELSLRVSHGGLNVVGGNPSRRDLPGPVPATAESSDFINSDVEEKFIGDPDRITDNVKIDRLELAALYRKQISSDSSLKVGLGGAQQLQRAIYSHGFDYNNRDHLFVGQVEYQKAQGDNHIVSVGVDHKSQFMDSKSQVLFGALGLPKDNLDVKTYGLYLQDTWVIDDFRELSAVLRADHLETRWDHLEQGISRTILAPRLYYKQIHNPVLTSRAGLGIGYRTPLTLFESQHGTYEEGFIVGINRVETAQSFFYSLAGQRLNDFFEVSTHFTRIENMAFGEDRVASGQPTLFRNSDNPYLISVFDASYGRRVSDSWNFETLVEVFEYPRGCKEKLPVAAIERRFSFISNWQLGAWATRQRLILVPEQDLSAYGYDDHYNIAFTDSVTLEPVFSSPKRQRSPTYWTLDLDFERALSKAWTFAFSVRNVFDYTQTRDGDSPLTWARHGTHYHLDNFHIWGPLRGRQIFLSFNGSF